MRPKQNKRKAARAKAPPKKREYDPDPAVAMAEIMAEALKRPQPQAVWDRIAQAQARSKLVDPPKAKSGGARQPQPKRIDQVLRRLPRARQRGRGSERWDRFVARVKELREAGQTRAVETAAAEIGIDERTGYNWLQQER